MRPFWQSRFVGGERVIALATDEWDLDSGQWRDLLSPASADHDVDTRISVVREDLILTLAPISRMPERPPVLSQSRRVEGAAWQLVRPGVYRSPIPKNVDSQSIVNVELEARGLSQQLPSQASSEWSRSREGEPHCRDWLRQQAVDV